VTVRDTETYIKHYTGNIVRKSREETSSQSKERTVVVPSINEMALIDKTLCNINLSHLNDSLGEVNLWLDKNMNQILDADDDKAERVQTETTEKASCIGQTTFIGGMTLLFLVLAVNFANSWLRSKVMKRLEKELEKNRSLVERRRKMMYAIVHDLRTPLSIIIGYNDMEKQLNGDYEKICHVAMNLLDNAFKFTKEGEVSLGVSYVNGELIIKVSDTGIGIKAADQQRVFTPFTRFSNAVTTGKDGFGIGLSTAKMLTQLMKGTITFCSSDSGTTFDVRLPLKEAEISSEPADTEVVKASGEKSRLLIVDDSRTWLMMMQGILQQNGFECDICSDTGKMFDMIREKRYSLIMLDLQMPGKSGVELLRLMRKSKVGNSQTVPVVVSTASAEDVREDLIEAGFDEYIPKMAQTEVMIRLINEVISRNTNTVRPDFSQLRKSVAQYLIEETKEAVEGLHEAIDKMDFEGMDSWAHSLKSSWVLYRIGVLVDPVMEIARKKDSGASARLAECMAEIDKMATIVINKAQEELDRTDE